MGYDEYINPCNGCEDYNPLKGTCESKGGCGRPHQLLDVDTHYIQDGFPVWYKWYCSECGYVRKLGWATSRDGTRPIAKYCENCGAKMEENA